MGTGACEFASILVFELGSGLVGLDVAPLSCSTGQRSPGVDFGLGVGSIGREGDPGTGK